MIDHKNHCSVVLTGQCNCQPFDESERAAIREVKLTGPSAFALSIDHRLRGVNIGPVDAEFLINTIKARTRS